MYYHHNLCFQGQYIYHFQQQKKGSMQSFSNLSSKIRIFAIFLLRKKGNEWSKLSPHKIKGTFCQFGKRNLTAMLRLGFSFLFVLINSKACVVVVLMIRKACATTKGLVRGSISQPIKSLYCVFSCSGNDQCTTHSFSIKTMMC